MRKVLSIISVLAAATFVVTFLGQSAAFYRWHHGSMELRRNYLPADQVAARDFESRIWQSYPRWQEWMMIRVLSGGMLVAALTGFWIERRGRHSHDA